MSSNPILDATLQQFDAIIGQLERKLPKREPLPWEVGIYHKTINDGSLFQGFDLDVIYKWQRESIDDAPTVRLVSITLTSLDRIEIPIFNFTLAERQYLEDEIGEKIDEREARDAADYRHGYNRTGDEL